MPADLPCGDIRVNAMTPGTTGTPWIGRLLDRAQDPEAQRSALNARQPHGTLVSVPEVADAIAYLASPVAVPTTGTWLAVDGGMRNVRLRPQR